MKVKSGDKTGQGEGAISLGGKAAYGVGAVGESVFFALFGLFITIYYNQIVGLSNSLIGTAVMLALIGDAITDPIVGIMSDRWHSRFGRRHPFLVAAPVPLVLAIFCIFNPPEALTAGADGPSAMPMQMAHRKAASSNNSIAPAWPNRLKRVAASGRSPNTELLKPAGQPPDDPTGRHTTRRDPGTKYRLTPHHSPCDE